MIESEHGNRETNAGAQQEGIMNRRTGAEDRVGGGRIALFDFDLSHDAVCAARACVGDDA